MDLSKLKYAKGSKRNRKRIGRGGAHGKTATKGEKGQLSRAGIQHRAWFEGGQMPIQRRLPKRGFKNFNRKESQIINVGDLARISKVDEITPEVMVKHGLIKNSGKPVKVLGDGTISQKFTVTANAFSKSAKEKIEAAGGKVNVL